MWRPDRRGDEPAADDLRELETLEMVLAGAPGVELGAGGAELSWVVAAVRSDHPPLRADFADELGVRVRGGFARPAGSPVADGIGGAGDGRARHEGGRARHEGGRARREGGRARRRLGSPSTIRGAGSRLSRPARGQWLAGLGAAASVAIGAVIVGGLVPGSSSRGRAQTASRAAADSSVGTAGGVPGGTAASAAPQNPARLPNGQLAYTTPSSESAPAKAASGATATATPNKFAINGAMQAPAPVPAAGSTASGAARAVESDASLALVAPRGRVQQVADAAIAATDRLGGIVESSNVTVAAQGGSQATLALEVPSGGLDRTLATISALAHVSSRSQATQDITDPTNAARQRLTESRDERTALLRQLGAASTPNQVASIRGQLGLVDGRIAQDEASLQRLLGHASMASVSVTITEAGRAVMVGGGGGNGSPWRPARALASALGVLEAVFAVLVVGLAALVPAAAVAALAWGVAGVVRRRRRLGALARSS
jgi:hypothetical protein